MLKTYEYRLYPNIAQEAKIQQHFGCTRYVYNKALELKISTYEKDKTNLSKYDLTKLITQWKTQDDTLWLKEVYSQALQQYRYENLLQSADWQECGYGHIT